MPQLPQKSLEALKDTKPEEVKGEIARAALARADEALGKAEELATAIVGDRFRKVRTYPIGGPYFCPSCHRQIPPKSVHPKMIGSIKVPCPFCKIGGVEIKGMSVDQIRIDAEAEDKKDKEVKPDVKPGKEKNHG